MLPSTLENSSENSLLPTRGAPNVIIVILEIHSSSDISSVAIVDNAPPNECPVTKSVSISCSNINLCISSRIAVYAFQNPECTLTSGNSSLPHML